MGVAGNKVPVNGAGRRLAVAELQMAEVSATAGDLQDEPVLRAGVACGGARVRRCWQWAALCLVTLARVRGWHCDQ